MADDNKQTPAGNLQFRGTNALTDLPPVNVAAFPVADPLPMAKIPEPPIPVPPAPPPTPPQTGGRPKEMEPSFAPSATLKASEGKPVDAITEIPSQVEVEKKPELQGFMEPVQKEEIAVKPVVDDYTQEILLKQINPGVGTVTLPLTEEEVQADLHKDIFESVRWLAEWCVRQIKLLHGKVVYRSEK